MYYILYIRVNDLHIARIISRRAPENHAGGSCWRESNASSYRTIHRRGRAFAQSRFFENQSETLIRLPLPPFRHPDQWSTQHRNELRNLCVSFCAPPRRPHTTPCLLLLLTENVFAFDITSRSRDSALSP